MLPPSPWTEPAQADTENTDRRFLSAIVAIVALLSSLCVVASHVILVGWTFDIDGNLFEAVQGYAPLVGSALAALLAVAVIIAEVVSWKLSNNLRIALFLVWGISLSLLVLVFWI